MTDKPAPIDMGDIYIGGPKRLDNPENRKVSDDSAPQDETRMSGGAKMHPEGSGSVKMDLSNPARTQILPDEHPLEKQFTKTPRGHFGAGLSDN